jgi:hypothetical protein
MERRRRRMFKKFGRSNRNRVLTNIIRGQQELLEIQRIIQGDLEVLRARVLSLEDELDCIPVVPDGKAIAGALRAIVELCKILDDRIDGIENRVNAPVGILPKKKPAK